jgi:hypothetical protein
VLCLGGTMTTYTVEVTKQPGCMQLLAGFGVLAFIICIVCESNKNRQPPPQDRSPVNTEHASKRVSQPPARFSPQDQSPVITERAGPDPVPTITGPSPQDPSPVTTERAGDQDREAAKGANRRAAGPGKNSRPQPPQRELRSWQASGTEIRARFGWKVGNEVKLRLEDGTVIAIPFDDLSSEDQAYVMEQRKKR